jgi:hypothetical protein
MGNTTSFLSGSPPSGVSCAGPSDAQSCYKNEVDKCEMRFNIQVMLSAWGSLPVTTQAQRIKRMMRHEIGHCMGFSDFLFAGAGGNYLMYAFDTSTPENFTIPEVTSLQDYVP